MDKVAVLLPCYNEAGAIGDVVRAFKAALPQADIYVYDNNSSDTTAQEALEAGAIVRQEPRQGKGSVVRTMFRDIDADYYVMADGDGTYDASLAPKMLQKAKDNRLAMVVGRRVSAAGEETYRAGHVFGNWMLTSLAKLFFTGGFTDILSGYRVFSRAMVNSFTPLSDGFQIETEMTVHALSLKLPVGEVDTPYYERAGGTKSKLSTYKDGFRILFLMIRLFKDLSPLIFFSVLAAAFFVLGLIPFLDVLLEYFQTGLVERFPTLIVAMMLFIVSALSLFSGFILDSIARANLSAHMMRYQSSCK